MATHGVPRYSMKCSRCAQESRDQPTIAALVAQPPLIRAATATGCDLIRALKAPFGSTLRSSTGITYRRIPPTTAASCPGTLLGERYRIISKLGAGGMGEVYRATDLRLGQQVALKFLPEEMARDPKALARFHNEVRIARQVSHPNVCRVYDIGEVEGMSVSFDGVRGRRGSELAAAPHRPAASRQSARDRAQALRRSRGRARQRRAASRSEARQHHDRRPRPGADHRFRTGRASWARSKAPRRATERPATWRPSNLTGKEVSVQSDIYALGVVLYEMFTGKPPFEATTRAELIRLTEEGMPHAAAQHRQGYRSGGGKRDSALSGARSAHRPAPRWRSPRRCPAAIRWLQRWPPEKRHRRKWWPLPARKSD